MTTQNQQHLGNIGVLDLRNASEEAVRSIGTVNNVGMFLTSPDTPQMSSQIHTGNVGAHVNAPAGAKFVNGGLTIGADHFRNPESPDSYIVNGRVMIEQGVSVDDLKTGLDSLYVNGSVFYPSALGSLVQAKLQWHNGRSVAYDDGDIIEEGRLSLNENYLESLSDDSKILVIGRLELPDVLPNELLERKIRSLKVTGSVRFHEENRQGLQSRIHQISSQSRMTVIPAGFQLCETPLDLNRATLQSLEAARLFVDGRVLIERDTDPALLDSAIAAIRSTDILICPEELSSVIAQKCDLLQTRAVFYRGELWLVEDETEVVPSRFEFMEGNATLVVRGEFSVSPEVEPKTLADRLEAVHNFGEIYCSQDQMGAIQSKMRTSEGEFHDYSARESGDTSDANYGYLAL